MENDAEADVHEYNLTVRIKTPIKSKTEALKIEADVLRAKNAQIGDYIVKLHKDTPQIGSVKLRDLEWVELKDGSLVYLCADVDVLADDAPPIAEIAAAPPMEFTMVARAFTMHLVVPDPDADIVVEANSQKLREEPVTFESGAIELVNGIPQIGKTKLRDQEWVELEDGRMARLDVEEKFENVSDDPDRLDGKLCHNCQLWDRPEGQRKFSHQSHRYRDGSFSQIEEIISAISVKNKAQPLTLTNVGYCPLHNKLCGETARACKDYKGKPWIARVRNWWVRAFR